MSCNPCCCLKLKDAAVTIGIWSTIYSLVQIAVFGWQFSVLAQCQHVIMAQSNLQCDYYCPCVGASTARTSAIIEIYSIMQLGIFGWQMNAIKYEKDRAANTLLPNYNTYGRYDIPTYYESYWQSPEERYYTGLFVIQILCLISAFFLLFASIMMIYGVHTWSRYLLVPWMVTMCASILTSLGYCIMWWTGDVRDYWLMLTIVEMFGVFINTYCFVVICMFHRRMLAELEYYARRRKYDRFSQPPRETPQGTIEQDIGETDEEFAPQKESFQRPPASQFPYQPSPSRQQPAAQTGPTPFIRDDARYGQRMAATQMPRRDFYPQQQQTGPPLDRFEQMGPPPIDPVMGGTLPRGDAVPRPRSAMERPFPPQYDDFRDVPRQAQRKAASYRQKSANACRQCSREQHKHCRHCHHCHHTLELCHCHRHSTRRRKASCSSICSISAIGADFSADLTEEPTRRRHTSSRRRRSRNKRARQQYWSDLESDLSEIGPPTVQSEQHYGNISALERDGPRRRYASLERQRRQQQQRGTAERQRGADLQPLEGEDTLGRARINNSTGTLPRGQQQQPPFPPHQGISIPQHIVIPPTERGAADAERKYRINSEITISYDPQRQQSPLASRGPPPVPSRASHPPSGVASPRSGYINLSAGSAHSTPTTVRRTIQQQQPQISMTSNV